MSINTFLFAVLAFSVGDTKQVVLCDAEKAEILHLFSVEYPVSCMHWMEVQDDSRWVLILRREDLFFLPLPVNYICFVFYLALCPHSASQRMSPAVSFQSYLPFLKGDTAQLRKSRNDLLYRRLNNRCLSHFILVHVFC